MKKCVHWGLPVNDYKYLDSLTDAVSQLGFVKLVTAVENNGVLEDCKIFLKKGSKTRDMFHLGLVLGEHQEKALRKLNKKRKRELQEKRELVKEKLKAFFEHLKDMQSVENPCSEIVSDSAKDCSGELKQEAFPENYFEEDFPGNPFEDEFQEEMEKTLQKEDPGFKEFENLLENYKK